MDTASAFGFEDLFAVALRDMAKSVSERTGETEAEQFARCQAAVHMILGLQPRDVIEVMLAGHCVMLHEVMTAEVHHNLRGETATKRRSVVSLNKAFNDNLDRLEQYRQRSAEGQRDTPEAPLPAAVPTATPEPARPAASKPNRAARRLAARAEMRAAATAARDASRQAAQAPPGDTSPV